MRKHNTINLPVVLYGCETWSLTLWGEHKLRVYENRVQRRIFVLVFFAKNGYNGQVKDD
jgi:hypothetical protein